MTSHRFGRFLPHFNLSRHGAKNLLENYCIDEPADPEGAIKRLVELDWTQYPPEPTRQSDVDVCGRYIPQDDLDKLIYSEFFPELFEEV